MGRACKTRARAALPGVEPEPSPGRASGSTHHYSQPSLVVFLHMKIAGIISFVVKSNLMKMQLLISILCYDLCNCNFHFQCHKSYFEVPNKSEDDDSLITEK